MEGVSKKITLKDSYYIATDDSFAYVVFVVNRSNSSFSVELSTNKRRVASQVRFLSVKDAEYFINNYCKNRLFDFSYIRRLYDGGFRVVKARDKENLFKVSLFPDINTYITGSYVNSSAAVTKALNNLDKSIKDRNNILQKIDSVLNQAVKESQQDFANAGYEISVSDALDKKIIVYRDLNNSHSLFIPDISIAIKNRRDITLEFFSLDSNSSMFYERLGITDMLNKAIKYNARETIEELDPIIKGIKEIILDLDIFEETKGYIIEDDVQISYDKQRESLRLEIRKFLGQGHFICNFDYGTWQIDYDGITFYSSSSTVTFHLDEELDTYCKLGSFHNFLITLSLDSPDWENDLKKIIERRKREFLTFIQTLERIKRNPQQWFNDYLKIKLSDDIKGIKKCLDKILETLEVQI